MKEICLDARMLPSSGIGTYLRNLILYLKESPFKLRLIGDPSSLLSLKVKGESVIPCTTPIYSVQEQMLLPLLIPSCDLFWSPHFNIPLFPIRAKKRLVTIHDLYHLAFLELLKPLEKRYAKIVISRAVKLSDRIITDSRFSFEELLKYTKANPEKIRVIPLGVDPSLFSHKKAPNLLKDVREKYRLPETFVLFVGNFKPHKNLKGLLKAFRLLLSEKRRDVFLVLVGKSEGFLHQEDVSTLLREDPLLAARVLSLGHIPEQDLSSLYQLATVAICPSFYEGFGLPPLEAMSSGCAVIASRAASLPEVCGDAVYYVNPHDPQEMASALVHVLEEEELRERLCKEGIARSQCFRWETTAHEHLALIEEILCE